MQQTTAQYIFSKYSEMKWIDFVEWLLREKEQILKMNKDEIEIAHFHGSLRNGYASDYYRDKYESFMDSVHIVKAWVNGVWYQRLYYKQEMINDFVSVNDAVDYAKKNYDRTTDTIKKNQAT